VPGRNDGYHDLRIEIDVEPLMDAGAMLMTTLGEAAGLCEMPYQQVPPAA